MRIVDRFLAGSSTQQFVDGSGHKDFSLCPLLQPLYVDFNGGYFWNRALLIRPWTCTNDAPLTLAEWNDDKLWKDEYGEVCKGVLFFAEDAFGVQHGVRADEIVQFDPETADFSVVGDTVEKWCRAVQEDPEFHTGFPLLAAWEKRNGPIAPGYRLLPKKLFIFGVEFKPENMACKRDIDGMRARAQLWKLTKDIPDGQKVVFKATED